METQLGLPVAPHMLNLEGRGLPKLQISFIDYVCAPLWNALGEVFHSCCGVLVQNLKRNRSSWVVKLESFDAPSAAAPAPSSSQQQQEAESEQLVETENSVTVT